MENKIELCCYCKNNTALTDCANTDHWEKRLKVYRLSEDRAADVRLPGTRESRHVQLTPMDADQRITGPLVLPENEDLKEVFVMDSLGMRYQHEPTRFWPNPQQPFGSTYIKSGRMGLVYGQEMPS